MKALSTLPSLEIEVDDVQLSVQDSNALRDISVTHQLSTPAFCELSFLDPKGPLARAESMTPGELLRITVKGQDVPLFSGQVTAVEYNHGASNSYEVRVRSQDLLHQLNKRQKVRAHVQVSTADLARELISDLGFNVEINDSDTGPVWQRLVQFWQSDLELLTEISERCGIYFTLRGNHLHLLTLSGFGKHVALALGETLLEVKIEVNSETACKSVLATGWDPWHAVQHSGYVDQTRVGRRIKTEVSPAQLGGTEERTLVDNSIQDDSQAEAIAQSELDRRVAQVITLKGVAEGDTRLRPGTPIEISGVSEPLAGQYVVTSVRHSIDQRRGFISEIDTAPPVPRKRSTQTLMTLGIVTQVTDPESLGRVKVSLPTYEDIETDWLEVVIPGAGIGKGSVILPDVDDKVLILLPNQDPAQAVVLGGLYGVEGLPDEVIKDGAIRSYTIQTPGEQRIRLDDEDKKVRIENSTGNHLHLSPGRVRLRERNGSYLELSDNKLQIHAETDLEIEAPGRTITIRSEAINFERG